MWQKFIYFILASTQIAFIIYSQKGHTTETPGSEIILMQGSTKVFRAPPLASVYISNGKVLATSDQENALVIKAKRKGECLLKIGSQRYNVIVLEKNQYQDYLALHKVVSTFMGLKLKTSTEKLVIDGELLRLSDWIAISSLKLEQLDFRATVDNAIASKTKSYFGELLKKHGLPIQPIYFEPRARLLIPESQKGTEKLYSELLSPFGINIELDQVGIALAPMIRTSIIVAEVKKTFVRALGVSWPESYSAQLVPKLKTLGSDPNTISLNAIEENGWGRILASPNLLCRSGKSASFLAGGEFPIKIANFKQHDVIWKKYGVLLIVKPLADINGQMSIEISTEVSSIDKSHEVDGIPGMHTNRMTSHFDLKKSATIALSGLLLDESGRAKEGLPFLQQIPILGNLFASQNYREHKTELIVFVTPKIIFPSVESSPIELPNVNDNEL